MLESSWLPCSLSDFSRLCSFHVDCGEGTCRDQQVFTWPCCRAPHWARPGVSSPLSVTRWVCWLTFSPCTCARCSRNVQRQGTSVLGFPSLRWNGDEDKQRGVEGAQRCLVFLLATGEALLASRLVLSHLQGHPTGIYKVIVLDAGGEAWELHSKNISCLHRVHMIRKEH